MFGHDNNTDDDKDVQINDELLQPEGHSGENVESGDQNEHSDNGAVEVTPSAPTVDENTNDSTPDSSDDNHKEKTDESTVVEPTPAAAGSDDLMEIKQQALKALSPLLGHLDQTPEEKFRTTMMLIQASDNQELIKTAYEAAQAMPDEKARAQALLDIVNEINYFTQKNT
jgi:hypothetical protein